jgi:hypothetical protein
MHSNTSEETGREREAPPVERVEQPISPEAQLADAMREAETVLAEYDPAQADITMVRDQGEYASRLGVTPESIVAADAAIAGDFLATKQEEAWSLAKLRDKLRKYTGVVALVAATGPAYAAENATTEYLPEIDGAERVEAIAQEAIPKPDIPKVFQLTETLSASSVGGVEMFGESGEGAISAEAEPLQLKLDRKSATLDSAEAMDVPLEVAMSAIAAERRKEAREQESLPTPTIETAPASEVRNAGGAERVAERREAIMNTCQQKRAEHYKELLSSVLQAAQSPRSFAEVMVKEGWKNIIPFRSGLRSLGHGVSGKDGDGCELKGYDRLKRMMTGALDVIVDAALFGSGGTIGRNILTTKRAYDVAGMAAFSLKIEKVLSLVNDGRVESMDKVGMVVKIIEEQGPTEKLEAALDEALRSVYGTLSGERSADESGTGSPAISTIEAEKGPSKNTLSYE